MPGISQSHQAARRVKRTQPRDPGLSRGVAAEEIWINEPKPTGSSREVAVIVFERKDVGAVGLPAAAVVPALRENPLIVSELIFCALLVPDGYVRGPVEVHMRSIDVAARAGAMPGTALPGLRLVPHVEPSKWWPSGTGGCWEENGRPASQAGFGRLAVAVSIAGVRREFVCTLLKALCLCALLVCPGEPFSGLLFTARCALLSFGPLAARACREFLSGSLLLFRLSAAQVRLA